MRLVCAARLLAVNYMGTGECGGRLRRARRAHDRRPHSAAGLACAFLLPTRQAMVSLYGIVCNGILLAYYGAPLSTIGTVLKKRSAASIYLPMVLLNGMNAAFWSAYALAIHDVYILVPNAIGLGLAGVQTLLCVAMGRLGAARAASA